MNVNENYRNNWKGPSVLVAVGLWLVLFLVVVGCPSPIGGVGGIDGGGGGGGEDRVVVNKISFTSYRAGAAETYNSPHEQLSD